MVDVAKYFLAFLEDESCGKCLTCREGTGRMHEVVTRITEGKGRPGDIDLLRRLADTTTEASLCALGGTAANPLLSTLEFFPEEYEEHIEEGVCRALVCKELIRYEIIDEKCTACGICRKQCPTDAISGAKKTVHVLDQEKCIRCGVCYDACDYGSIKVVSGKYERVCEQTKFKLQPVKAGK